MGQRCFIMIQSKALLSQNAGTYSFKYENELFFSVLENKISFNRHRHHHHHHHYYHHQLASHSSLGDLWPTLGGLVAWVRER